MWVWVWQAVGAKPHAKSAPDATENFGSKRRVILLLLLLLVFSNADSGRAGAGAGAGRGLTMGWEKPELHAVARRAACAVTFAS